MRFPHRFHASTTPVGVRAVPLFHEREETRQYTPHEKSIDMLNSQWSKLAVALDCALLRNRKRELA